MLEAVKQKGYAIKYIEQHFRTHEIMLEAVKQNRCAIKYIEHHFRTPEIIKMSKI